MTVFEITFKVEAPHAELVQEFVSDLDIQVEDYIHVDIVSPVDVRQLPDDDKPNPPNLGRLVINTYFACDLCSFQSGTEGEMRTHLAEKHSAYHQATDRYQRREE